MLTQLVFHPNLRPVTRVGLSHSQGLVYKQGLSHSDTGARFPLGIGICSAEGDFDYGFVSSGSCRAPPIIGTGAQFLGNNFGVVISASRPSQSFTSSAVWASLELKYTTEKFTF